MRKFKLYLILFYSQYYTLTHFNIVLIKSGRFKVGLKLNYSFK